MRYKMSKVLVALLLVMVLVSTSALAASYGAKVLTSSMTVYAKPKTSAQALGSLNQGTSFSVTAISGNWAQISYKGYTGYAQMKNIIFDDYIKGVVTKDAPLRFITKASYKKEIYYTATISQGSSVRVVGINGNYLLIESPNGNALGCIRAEYVTKA